MANVPEPTSAEGRAVDALRALQERSVRLRRDLVTSERATASVIDGLCAGTPLDEVLAEARSAEVRPLVTDALTTYERQRRQARLRVIATAVSQGMTVEDIQERWAITRSLAVRNVRLMEKLDT